MARYRGPYQKVARRFREPIFGPSKVLHKKNYGPGQHGRMRRGKISDYAMQLAEKQKAKYIYGMLERPFRRFFRMASRMKGSTGENLMQLLERRLDNIVFRLGFARTRAMARQMIRHGHILVNQKPVDIPSYLVRVQEVISLAPKAQKNENFSKVLQASRCDVNWLSVNKAQAQGTLLYVPPRNEIPEIIQERFIVELYSK
ncbi:MAG: 30S ribosomal protein S4 [Bacteroidia bacterium]